MINVNADKCLGDVCECSLQKPDHTHYIYLPFKICWLQNYEQHFCVHFLIRISAELHHQQKISESLTLQPLSNNQQLKWEKQKLLSRFPSSTTGLLGKAAQDKLGN